MVNVDDNNPWSDLRRNSVIAMFWSLQPFGAVQHSSNEPGDLSQWQCHDDSSINIITAVSIIAIIIKPSYVCFAEAKAFCTACRMMLLPMIIID